MKQKSNSQLLIFKINEQFFAVNTKHIKEIIEHSHFFAIPVDTPHILGILLHRNEAIAVLNTNYYFEIKPKKHNFYIILNHMVSLPVDELGGIFNAVQFKRGDKKIKSPFLSEIFYINDRAVSVVDYEELINHEGQTVLFPI